MQVRDCMKYDEAMTSRLLPRTACLIDQHKLEEMLKPLMPHSVLSMHAQGKLCYCDEDHCVDIIEKADIIPGACPEGDIEWGQYW